MLCHRLRGLLLRISRDQLCFLYSNVFRVFCCRHVLYRGIDRVEKSPVKDEDEPTPIPLIIFGLPSFPFDFPSPFNLNPENNDSCTDHLYPSHADVGHWPYYHSFAQENLQVAMAHGRPVIDVEVLPSNTPFLRNGHSISQRYGT